MRKVLIIIFIILAVVEFGFAIRMVVKASSPNLSISVVSNDIVQLTGYGDANASVLLYYQNYQNGMQSQYICSTNSSGYFSTNLSRNAYGINPGSYVYIVVNNQQSSSVAWPSGSGSANISLSQTSLTVYPGQTQTVTIYGSGNYYVSINSNANVASASISGSTLNIAGYSVGSTNVTVCQNYGQCAVLYVSVSANQYDNQYNNYGYQNYDYNRSRYNLNSTPITFSQTNLNLGVNQNTSVTISGGARDYYIDYISDEGALRGSINDNTLSLTGHSTSRNVVVVCSSSGNNCAALAVTVGGNNIYYPYDNNSYNQNWVYCASENQYCSFSGSRSVRYGANGSYYYKTFTNGVNCSNYIFGDPVFGVVKQCSISNY